MKIKAHEIHYVSMGTPCPFLLLDDHKEIKYKESIFPGGEVYIKLLSPVKMTTPTESHILICASITSSDSLMNVIMMTDALRRAGANKVSLFMPYVPYARQDRVCNPGESHSMRVFANLINAQNYFEVIVFDPHSDVTSATINDLVIIDNHMFVRIALSGITYKMDPPIPFDEFVMVSPDAGALKKMTGLVKYLMSCGSPITELVQADKLRNLETGEIIKTVVHATDLNGADCVIVDDICDGGRTFIELSKVLKQKNAGRIALIVSHGIFSKGLQALIPYIDYLVYSDSFRHFMPLDNERDRYHDKIKHTMLPLLDVR